MRAIFPELNLDNHEPMDINPAAPLAQGLIAHFPLNEGSGGKVQSVGGEFTGRLLAASSNPAVNHWVAGRTGMCIENALSRGIGIPETVTTFTGYSRFNLATPELSVGIWFNPRAVTGTYHTLLTKRAVGGGSPYHYEISIDTATGKVIFFNGTIYSSDYVPPVNAWTFAFVTVRGIDIKIYINGNLNATATTTAFPAITSGALSIGWNGADNTNNFVGFMEHFYLYSRALLPGEVAELYANPWATCRPASKRQWSFGGAARFALSTAIAFDAASNSGYKTLEGSATWSHTCTGSSRFLAVDVSLLSVPGTTVTSITYNGVAMSFIGAISTVSGSGRVECWGLVAPSSGTHDIVVTLSAAVAFAGTAVSYTNVHQTSPTEGFNDAQATNVGAADATVDVTTVADNDWVHAAVATDDTAITANQTSRNNVTGAAGSGADEDTGPKTPAGVQTMSYTNVGALATWAIAGYAIRPVSASTLGVSTPKFYMHRTVQRMS